MTFRAVTRWTRFAATNIASIIISFNSIRCDSVELASWLAGSRCREKLKTYTSTDTLLCAERECGAEPNQQVTCDIIIIISTFFVFYRIIPIIVHYINRCVLTSYEIYIYRYHIASCETAKKSSKIIIMSDIAYS